MYPSRSRGRWWAVKDLLGNINKALIQRLLESKYGGDKSVVPTIDYLAVQSKAVPKTLPGVTRTEVGNLATFKFETRI
jgi:fatty acid synthase subunit alpha